jgi:hypothetical protein
MLRLMGSRVCDENGSIKPDRSGDSMYECRWITFIHADPAYNPN